MVKLEIQIPKSSCASYSDFLLLIWPVKINHILIINTLPFTTNAQWEENQRTDLKKIRGNRVRQSELILYSQLLQQHYTLLFL